NPVLRMMGLPNLPKKLPSRNWMIFWGILGSFSAAIIYDKREKKRATARWSHAVSHLGKETLKDPRQLPRKLTIYLESPPGDGLRVAQDHYSEFIKPILAASGLDWEFVQGRQQGDVRAAVAEKIRRNRRETEEPAASVKDPQELTSDEIIHIMRKNQGTPEWTGTRGDIVVGRHAWKEYIRGLHEGWLGPLTEPPRPTPEVVKMEAPATPDGESAEGEKEEIPKPEEKPSRPPQPVPYNTTNDYPTSSIPMLIPAEFSPSTPIPFPHVLGFLNTPTRLYRFLNRRKLADQIGREVAAVCLEASREYRDGPASTDSDSQSEFQTALEHEEKDWVKTVWKEEVLEEGEVAPLVPKEKIWAKPIVVDPRIAMRMRRFEIRPEDEARAREVKVPEEEVEGWIKASLRSMWRW
ncbi:mitochondrial import inner membrane translocase subunit Tim54, partial [Pseudomassariella vexata]